MNIVIVGASSGIGYRVAQIYIDKGWRVGVAARRTEQLEQLKAMAPERVFCQELDITCEDAPQKLDSLIEAVGGMDIYLHVSGIGKQNLPLDSSIELQTVKTNAEGFTRLIDYSYNYFKARGKGHIAVVSSIAGTKGLGSAPAYSATKRYQNCYIDALAQLSKMMAHGITFTDIRPGFVKTDLLNDKQNYPMLMKVDSVARSLVGAIARGRRSVVIDWRYAILVQLWRLIPRWLWERLPIRTTSKKE